MDMQTATIHNPLGLEIIDATNYAPIHGVDQPEKRDAIAEDMRLYGWQGAPLVVLPEYGMSLTGVHRRAAAEVAGLDEIPGVSLESIFEACDLDLWEIASRPEYEQDCCQMDYSRLVQDQLPGEILEAYGLDLH